MKYKHLKSGRTYEVLKIGIINATNAQDGETMVLYEGEEIDGAGIGTFVREISEFTKKFEIIHKK